MVIECEWESCLFAAPFEGDDASEAESPCNEGSRVIVGIKFEPEAASEVLEEVVGRVEVVDKRHQVAMESRLVGDKQASEGKLRIWSAWAHGGSRGIERTDRILNPECRKS